MCAQKLTISMWEYSWLTRRWGDENEFNDWNVVLDEAVDRGYNCLRIDPYPQLFLSEKSTQEIRALPKHAFWGCHFDSQVSIKKDLREFMTLCKEKNIKVGLSGWYVADKEDLFKKTKSKEVMVDMWVLVLKFLEEHNLLEIVDWVDPVNEWPLSYPDPANNIFSLAFRRKSFMKRTNEFLAFVLRSLKDIYPDLKYTFSFTVEHFPRKKEREKLDLREFDLLEIHTWLSSWFWFRYAIKHRLFQYSQNFPFKISIKRFAKRAKDKYYEQEEKWLNYFREEMLSQIDWANELGVPIYNTEGYITIFYLNAPPDLGFDVWEWYRDASQQCHQIATEIGFDGLCTSNFSEPYFDLWKKPEWHKKLNEYFLNFK